jgi:hypothetical protein
MKLSNRRKVVLAITVIICIGFGLACSQNKVWVKPGTSQQDLNIDKDACTKEVREASYTAKVKDRHVGYSERSKMELFTACMNARGWYLKEQ